MNNQAKSDLMSMFSRNDDNQIDASQLKNNKNFQSISSIKHPNQNSTSLKPESSRDLFPFLDENIAQVHLNKITGNITRGGLGPAATSEPNDLSYFIRMGIKNPATRGGLDIGRSTLQEGDTSMLKSDRMSPGNQVSRTANVTANMSQSSVYFGSQIK